MTKESPKQNQDTISWSPGNRFQSCLRRHRIRGIRQNIRILCRHRQLLTRFPGDRLIVSKCCFRLLFVFFFFFSYGYFDKNRSSTLWVHYLMDICAPLTNQRRYGLNFSLIITFLFQECLHEGVFEGDFKYNFKGCDCLRPINTWASLD